MTSVIGDSLRMLRETARLTVPQLAKLAGTAPAYLSSVESGSVHPSTALVSKLARCIEVTLAAPRH